MDNRGSVAVVTREGAVKVLAGPFSAVEGLVWSPDGRSVLFTGSPGTDLGSAVYRITLEGDLTPIYPAMGDLKILDIGAQGRWLTLRETVRPEIFARAPGAAEVRQLGWRAWPTGSRITPDGSRILFSDQSSAAGHGYGVAIQGTDGSAIVELGSGVPMDLSPDGAWVLTLRVAEPVELWLYPTGPGDARRIEAGKIRNPTNGAFFADGRSVLYCGQLEGRPSRCFEIDLESLELTPRTPENTFGGIPSPDGSKIAAATGQGIAVFPTEGGEEQPVPGTTARDQLVRWSPDGRHLWLARPTDDARVEVEAVEPDTGNRSSLIVVAPRDRRGIVTLDWLSLADDPTSYAYTARRRQSALFEISMRP